MVKFISLIAFALILSVSALSSATGLADYVCGDANSDGSLNIADAVYMINYIFKGGPPPDSGCCGETCTEGATEPCYSGPPETMDVGTCVSGTRTCTGGVWGPCIGEILPQAEECDGADNDCNGIPDDGDPGNGPCNTGQPGVCAEGTYQCIDGNLVCEPNEEPTAEVCDGLDNDCDGIVDNGFDVGQPCIVGEGACARVGIMICKTDGTGTECSVDPGTPTAEICDGLDNDCDGIIDNGFDVGEPCTVGIGGCQRHGVMVCRGDGTGTECSVDPGAPTTEICDGLDNDCDGIIDNGFDVGEPCSVGTGECQNRGVKVCKTDGTGTECSVDPGAATAEICDGLDNDCDGIIDNGFDVGEPCTAGTGECKNYGVKVCKTDGTGTECSVDPGAATAEICDGLDNDCDGVIDNGFDVGEPCTAGTGECKNYGVKVCKTDGTGTECSVDPGAATAEVCDGLDNDCDGVIDNGFDVGDPCTAGLGVCQNYGVKVCKGDGTGTECSVNPGTPSTEVCNGLDDDCDGTIDNGFDVGDPCSVGVGACQRWGTRVCDPANPTQTVCDATAGVPSTEICSDGIDNDCDGYTDAEDPDCQP